MVQICSPAVSIRRSSFRRFCAVGGVVLAATILAGCAQGARFAEGSGSQGLAYEQVEVDSTHNPAFDPPPRPLIEPVATSLQPAPSWIPQKGARPWKYIIIHHSATTSGGAAQFDKEHRGNGWDELGYHFVIGNGTDTRDGAVEIGPRWVKQKHGAHAKTPDNRFNDYGIGICLVGNFENGRPSPQQMKSLTALVSQLMQRYNIPANRVIGHDDTGRVTACPGRNLELQLAGIRRAAVQQIAARQGPGQERTAVFATEQR